MGKQPTDSKKISKEKIPKSYKRALNNYIPTSKYIDDFDEKYSDIYRRIFRIQGSASIDIEENDPFYIVRIPDSWCRKAMILTACYLGIGIDLARVEPTNRRFIQNFSVQKYTGNLALLA